MCLKRWKWFVVSFCIIMAFSVYKVKKTEPIYARTATILVKEDKTSTMGSLASAFGDFGGFSAASDVNNELEAIKSPAIMLEVIGNLGLNTDYISIGNLRPHTLYGRDLPFLVSFPGYADDKNTGINLKTKLSSDGNLDITKITVRYAGKNNEIDTKLSLNINHADSVDSPIGTIVVNPNPKFAGSVADMEKPMDIVVIYTPVEWQVDRYTNSMKAMIPNRKAAVINLTFPDVSVERSTDVLNGVIDVYKERWMKDKNLLTDATAQFIDDRLSLIEQDLGVVDRDISQYKSSHQLPDIETMVKTELSKLTVADQAILDTNSKLTIANDLLKYISDPANNDRLLPSLISVSPDRGLEQDVLAYNTMMMDRNRIATGNAVNNPIVKDYDKRLEGMRQSIAQSIRNQITALETTLGDLRKERAESSGKISASPNQANDLLSIERQQKVKESLYLFLLEKREENNMSRTFTAYNIRVLTPPMGPSSPIAPNSMKSYLFAFVFSMFIPLVMVFLAENFDTTLRTREELEKEVKAPIAGVVPYAGKKPGFFARLRRHLGRDQEDTLSEIVVESGSGSAVNEAFRILRSNIDMMNSRLQSVKDGHGVVLALTSAIPSSGKTFVSVNLAKVYTLKKKRVLVIDADLRKGTLSKSLHVNNPGLSGFLSGECSLSEAIVKDVNGIENLDLLASGPIPPDPSELIDSPDFEKMINDLHGRYDLVVIDCPPSEAVTDATVISKSVDRTLYVVRRGNLKKDFLPELQKQYQSKRFTNMTLIFNGVESSSKGYGYGYGYGYGQKT